MPGQWSDYQGGGWGSPRWQARRQARGRPTDAATMARGPRNPAPRRNAGGGAGPRRSGGGVSPGPQLQADVQRPQAQFGGGQYSPQAQFGVAGFRPAMDTLSAGQIQDFQKMAGVPGYQPAGLGGKGGKGGAGGGVPGGVGGFAQPPAGNREGGRRMFGQPSGRFFR